MNKAIQPYFEWPYLLKHPQIPKPLHGLNPRTIKGQEWWDEQRFKAYAENNQCCWACGIHKEDAEYHRWLEAHECYEINYQKGVARLKLISALCHLCHNYIHIGRVQMMVDQGKMSMAFYEEVVRHGDTVLRLWDQIIPRRLNFLFKTRASLDRVKQEGERVAWADWRLVIGFKRYKPLFESFEAWHAHYTGGQA